MVGLSQCWCNGEAALVMAYARFCTPLNFCSDTVGAGWELKISKETDIMTLMGLSVAGTPLPKDVRVPSYRCPTPSTETLLEVPRA